MANKIINQSGKEVFAVGQDGSHARNLVEFDVTIPKLIDRLFFYWCNDVKSNQLYRLSELYSIMEEDAVPKEKWNQLYQSAYYYFTVQKT